MSSNRWLIVALIVSLGINLGLAGFFLGRASSGQIHPPQATHLMWGVSRILRDLPADRRDALWPQYRAHMRAARADAREVHRAQQDLRSALLADPFDEAALGSSLDRFRDHLHASQTASHSAFIELIMSLTPQERALLVARMQQPRDGRHHQARRAGDLRPGGLRPGGVHPRPPR